MHRLRSLESYSQFESRVFEFRERAGASLERVRVKETSTGPPWGAREELGISQRARRRNSSHTRPTSRARGGDSTRPRAPATPHRDTHTSATHCPMHATSLVSVRFPCTYSRGAPPRSPLRSRRSLPWRCLQLQLRWRWRQWRCRTPPRLWCHGTRCVRRLAYGARAAVASRDKLPCVPGAYGRRQAGARGSPCVRHGCAASTALRVDTAPHLGR